MLTRTEAYQRCSINQVRLQRRPEMLGEYRVTLMEWPNSASKTEAMAYYTDDLEDAVLTGAMMRRKEKCYA